MEPEDLPVGAADRLQGRGGELVGKTQRATCCEGEHVQACSRIEFGRAKARIDLGRVVLVPEGRLRTEGAKAAAKQSSFRNSGAFWTCWLAESRLTATKSADEAPPMACAVRERPFEIGMISSCCSGECGALRGIDRAGRKNGARNHGRPPITSCIPVTPGNRNNLMGRSSGLPSIFSGRLPVQEHSGLWQSRQAYSSGGCAGIS